MAKASGADKKSATPKKATGPKKTAVPKMEDTPAEKPKDGGGGKPQVNEMLHSKLEQFFMTSLQELHWGEQCLVNVLYSMSEAATTNELRQSFKTHRDQTMTHVRRLEEVFDMMGWPREERHCVGMQGLFDEGWRMIDESEEGSAQRDVALIIAAQKVEHYEMACYGSLVTLAYTMGRSDVAELLIETLTEEKETDALLTDIAQNKVNYMASVEEIEIQ
jgi:ferritin-like metal-binding protein YciE